MRPNGPRQRTRSAMYTSESSCQRCQRQHRSEGDLGDRAVAQRRGEVDRRPGVEGRVDPAAVEVGVDQPGRGGGLVRPEVVGVAELRQHDLVTVRQVRKQLARRVLGRRREVELAADQQRLDVRVPDAACTGSRPGSRATRRADGRRPRGSRCRGCRSASHGRPGSRRIAGRRRRRFGRRRRRHPRPARAGRRACGDQRQQPRAAARRPCRVERACRSSTARRAGRAPSVVALMRPKNAAMRTLPFLIGRNQPAARACGRTPSGSTRRGRASGCGSRRPARRAAA